MKITAFLFLLTAFFFSASGQITSWKNYTDMKNVRSASSASSGIWAATTGGAFFYDPASDTYKKFHKTEGLSGSSLSSMAVDSKGRIWFGSSTGTIDIYKPDENSFRAVLDIYNSTKQIKGINEFFVKGDSVFLATDYGVSVMDPNTFLFIDTYARFGSLSSNLKVNSVYIGDLVYAALESAVAVQKPGSVNLSSPDSWNVYNVVYNGANKKIYDIAEYSGKIIAATESGLFSLEAGVFVPYINELQNISIARLAVIENDLYAVSSSRIYKFNGQFSEIFQSDRILNGVFTRDGQLYAYTEDGILKINEGQVSSVIKPNGPYLNLFSGLSVDAQGSLWSASGRDVTGRGFFKLSNDNWQNYNLSTNPEIVTNAYYNVFTSGDEVYIGSWGHGFIRIKNNQFTQFNPTNTPMQGISNDPSFLVIGGISKDSKNNLWVLNYAPVTREYLSMLTPDSVWYNFKVGSMLDQYLAENFGLITDPYDTKWFYSKSGTRPGLFYFNERGTYTNTADDRSGYISSELNEKVLSLAVDRRGDIWIGTALGINIISNSSAALNTTPSFRITSVYALRQQSINCITVDPLNRKWIGTNQGLLLVNSDGSQLLESFDSKNSPLLADIITSIAVDEKTGTVYVGTDAGLTSFETAAKLPVESFAELSIYPNPLHISGNATGIVTIDGLIKDAEIKILSVTGKLVNEFSSPGGRVAYWNGKDLNGEFVNSGVYIIIASDTDGNSVKSAKIAVLKE